MSSSTITTLLSSIKTLEERLDVVRQYIYLFPSETTEPIKQKEELIETPPDSDYPEDLTDNLDDVIVEVLSELKSPTTTSYDPAYILLLLSTSDACQVPLIRHKYHELLPTLLSTENKNHDILYESISYLLLHGLMCPLLAPRIGSYLTNALISLPNSSNTTSSPSIIQSVLSCRIIGKNNIEVDPLINCILNSPFPSDTVGLHATIRCLAGLIKHTSSEPIFKLTTEMVTKTLSTQNDLRTEVHLHAIISTCSSHPTVAKLLLTTPSYFSIIHTYLTSRPSRYSSVDIRYFALQTLVTSLQTIEIPKDTQLSSSILLQSDAIALALSSQPLLAHLGADSNGGSHPQTLGVLALKALALIVIRLEPCEKVLEHLVRVSVENVLATMGRCTLLEREDDGEKPPVVKSEVKNDRETALHWGLVLLRGMLKWEIVNSNKNDDKKESVLIERLEKCTSGLIWLGKAVVMFCDKTPDIVTLFVDVIKNVNTKVQLDLDSKVGFVHRFIQLLRDTVDSCYEHSAAKAVFSLCEMKLIPKTELPHIVACCITYLERFNELSIINVESLYSLLYVISEFDYESKLFADVLTKLSTVVLPWITSNQDKITSDESVMEKYDYLFLLIPKKVVKDLYKVYGDDCGEISEYCVKLIQ
ncbi:Uncharacterized protein QTN25_006706 [Entamoeba marina]